MASGAARRSVGVVAFGEEMEELMVFARSPRRIDLSGCRYLTDGVRLFRVVDSFGAHGGRLVALEDCHSLDLRLVSADRLGDRALRPVQPRRGRSGDLPRPA